MAEKKITKRDVLNHILDAYSNDAMVVAYATHELELLDKKVANAKMTKTQERNEELKKIIVETLTDCEEFLTITELQAKNDELKELSNQKITNLLTQLVKNNDIVRDDKKVKGKIVFGV